MVCSSFLKHVNEMLLGDPRQADQRRQNLYFSIVILDRATAQAPSSSSLRAFMNQSSTVRFLAPTSALEHLSRYLLAIKQITVLSRTQRAVEVIICMITHEFSLISMTSQASLSLSLSLSLSPLLLLLTKSRSRTI